MLHDREEEEPIPLVPEDKGLDRHTYLQNAKEVAREPLLKASLLRN